MATRQMTIEIPEALIERIEQAGLRLDADFVQAALTHEIERHMPPRPYPEADMLAALDETFGLCADSQWTMDDFLAMKREEWALEERKLNRL